MPRMPNFIGPTYSGRSITAAGERCINLYPEIVETPTGKNTVVYHGTPGLNLLANVGTDPVRTTFSQNGKAYAVIGGELVEVFRDWTTSSRGNIHSSGPAKIIGNGIQLLVSANGTAWIYDMGTKTIKPITMAETILDTGFMDLYGVVAEANSARIWISALMDLNKWDALDFATKEGWPDNLVGVHADHRELWLFGSETIEPWYDSGNPDFPFQRIQGAHIETGCASAATIKKLDNTIFWLAQNARGNRTVVRAQGYTPVRVSNHAIEFWLSTSRRISEATAFTYEPEGHAFFCLSVPDIPFMMVYDVSTGQWHERSWWDSVHAQYQQHRANCYMAAFGRHVVGDRETGKLYDLDMDTYTDDGAELRRHRIAPHLHNETKWIFYNEFRLDMETGVVPADGQGSDGKIMMQFSDDGGKTWSNEKWASMGGLGEYQHLIQWPGPLGRSRDRVIGVMCSEPVKQCWIDGHIEFDIGLS